MANTVNTSASLSATQTFGSYSATTNANGTSTKTATGNGVVKQTVSIGTTDETLPKGDIVTIGRVFIKNLDATNYITFGADSTNQPIRLNAGEEGIFRFNGTDMHAKANTGACLLEYMMVEA